MKKFFVSAGLVAASAAGIESAMAVPNTVSPKAWDVSATLRGFYDDNYVTSSVKQRSMGFEFSPQFSVSIPFQQTEVGLRYIYGLYYYQDREDKHQNAVDQSHQIDLWLDHAFTERWHARFTDTVAIGQEPELLAQSGPITYPYRVEGDNIANHARIVLDTEWTRLFSTELSYQNDFYDYDNSGTSVMFGGPFALFPMLNNVGVPGPNQLSASPSLAGLLNRVEQSFGVDLQWHLQHQTMVFVGYRFAMADYIGNEPIAVFNYFNPSLGERSIIYNSDARNSYTHYGSLGIQHQFTANIGAMARVGASYTDNYNDPLQKTTAVSPYADVSATYTYLPGSYLQLGFTQDQNATDIAALDSAGHLTEYQQTSSLYLDINHRITEKLLATVIARYQHSHYKGGQGNLAGSDDEYNIGLNLAYQITRHFSAEVGYNYDDLLSGLNFRGYNRNRVYFGVGANY